MQKDIDNRIEKVKVKGPSGLEEDVRRIEDDGGKYEKDGERRRKRRWGEGKEEEREKGIRTKLLWERAKLLGIQKWKEHQKKSRSKVREI